MATIKLARDLLVYIAFSALPIAGFLLAGTADTQFYVSLLTISFLGILGFNAYYADETSKFLNYDKDMESFSLLLIMFGVIACLFISSFLINTFAGASLASLNVPIPQTGLSVGLTVLPPFWSAILFTMCLISPAEECSKLVTTLGLYTWLKARGNRIAEAISVLIPIGAWSALHTYANQAYQGQFWFVYVGAAFISGLVIFYVMKKTSSLLAAILLHAFFNIIIIYATTY